MQDIIHKEQSVGDTLTYRMKDLYVKDREEAMTVKTTLLLQGSKLFIVETMELFILNEDGGVWYRVPDMTVLDRGDGRE